jgi:3-oxoacid CoA-transferase subunit B
VQRIITDLAVIDVIDPATGEVAPSGTLGDRALKLDELAPGVSEDEVREKTQPELVTS